MEHRHVYLGIDPGLRGAIAAIDAHGAVITTWTMPVIAGGVDAATIVRHLRKIEERDHIQIAALEHVGAMPGQGISSTFAFGAGWGIVRGVLAALGISVQLVRPPAWKRAILAGLPHDKTGAIQYCAHRWPDASLILPRCRTPHDGLADALCLAEYARRLGVRGGV